MRCLLNYVARCACQVALGRGQLGAPKGSSS
jgi:hypothetical protein